MGSNIIIQKGVIKKVSDRLINSAVLRRLEKAESEGNVELLEEHLKSNYDLEIHNAVYAALVRLGRAGAELKLKECEN